MQDNRDHQIYPYGVVLKSRERSLSRSDDAGVLKAYVSCWNDSSVAIVNPGQADKVSYVRVGSHPTKMLLSADQARLFVVNSDDDSVSVIDTTTDKEIERINVRLSENVPMGNSPEGLAVSGSLMYVANSHSNSLAVVELAQHKAEPSMNDEEGWKDKDGEKERSKVRGFIPTGQYPSAVAIIGNTIFVGNGKGTGLESSSVVVNNSGRVPNAPNDRFPAGTGRGSLGRVASTAFLS
jgi:YVTN family beta-propeller protein